MSIIPQNQQGEELFNTISSFFKTFKIGDLLRKCNACKQKGVPVLDIFKYKLCNVFSDRSMYMQMKTNSYHESFSKNTFYRFLDSAKGLLSEDEIAELIELIVSRGGYVKDLHGRKNMYYQVNATYYSALGESDKKLLFARAVQLFMPGKPQVWYLDLFAGKNDHNAVARAGENGHKEINRTNLTTEQADKLLKKDVVKEQLRLLRLRKTHPAFNSNSIITVTQDERRVCFTWKYGTHRISLTADFNDHSYAIESNA